MKQFLIHVEESKFKIYSSFIMKYCFFALSLIYIDYASWKKKKKKLLKSIDQNDVQKNKFLKKN